MHKSFVILLTNTVGNRTIVFIFFNIWKDAEENSSWDIVNENDLWDGGNDESDPEDYVLVGQEDIMDGIASFMAAYLLSLKQTKVRIILFVTCLQTCGRFLVFDLLGYMLNPVLLNAQFPEKALHIVLYPSSVLFYS